METIITPLYGCKFTDVDGAIGVDLSGYSFSVLEATEYRACLEETLFDSGWEYVTARTPYWQRLFDYTEPSLDWNITSSFTNPRLVIYSVNPIKIWSGSSSYSGSLSSNFTVPTDYVPEVVTHGSSSSPPVVRCTPSTFGSMSASFSDTISQRHLFRDYSSIYGITFGLDNPITFNKVVTPNNLTGIAYFPSTSRVGLMHSTNTITLTIAQDT